MNKWVFIILPVLSAAVLVAVSLTRPVPELRTAAAINASALFSLYPEFSAVRELKNNYRLSRAEADLVRPDSFVASDDRIGTLEDEWTSFSDGIQWRNSAVEAILRESALDEVEKEYFRLRSEYSGARDRTLLGAEQEQRAVFDVLSRRRPTPMLIEDKLRLLHIRLNLKVLTRDSFAMPEYRLEELRSREEEIHKEVNARERRFMEETQADFKRESEEMEKRLYDKKRALEEELELALSAAVSRAESSFGAGLEDQRMVAETAFSEGARRRQESMSVSEPDGKDGEIVVGALPLDFDEIEMLLETEFMRRLGRKAPAVAERNGNGIVYNTTFTGAGEAEDATGKFKKALGL